MINITTIIQIIHFWIAYYFVNKLFFSPILHFILAKKATRAIVFEDLKQREIAVATLNETKIRELCNFKKKTALLYAKTPFNEPQIPLLAQVFLDNKEKEKSIKACTKSIIQKIAHDF